MTTRTPAEVFPPGEFIRDEYEARGWTQQDLADILNRPLIAVNQIITGKRAITPETAKALGDAFGTGPELWINLESTYQLWKAANPDPFIARRARLYEYAPVNEMIRRNWITPSNNIDVLERQVIGFFGVSSLDDSRHLAVAARKATNDGKASPSEAAWFARVQQLSKAVSVKPFHHAAFVKQFDSLRTLIGSDPENIRHLPKVLAEWGIRFVIVETLQKTKIDGAAIWLAANQPAIAVSLRFDRIDAFWFTVIHELIHIKRKHKNVLDVDLISDSKGEGQAEPKSDVEQQTNKEAAEFLVPQKSIDDFVQWVKPLFSKAKIINFANQMKIHPGIVVGQHHHKKAILFSHSREMLLQGQIRKFLVDSALMDGWGMTPGPLE